MDKEFGNKLRWLIIISTIIRCIIANLIELGNDEVYYYSYALQPDWNHFDHPPMVGLLIKFFSLNMHWVSTFSMRLGPIVLAAVNTWLIACILRKMISHRAGFIAAMLYTTSFYASIISGVFILPDAIGNTFWLAALWCMITIIKADHKKEQNQSFIFLGLWIGLACLSKVHGIFLWIGFFTYTLAFQRTLFKRWPYYIAIVISLLLCSPVWFWNEHYDFITWKYHGHRVDLQSAGIEPQFFIQTTLGQLLYNNPILIFLYTCMGFLMIKKGKNLYQTYRQEFRLLLLCGLPFILITTGLSLFRQTLPHWSGPGFFSLMILTSLWLELQLNEHSLNRIKKVFNTLLNFSFCIIILGILIIHFYPGNPIGKKEGQDLGREDVTLELIGWKAFRQEFQEIRKQDIQSGQMKANAGLLINNWIPGGHLLFYIARPLELSIIAEGKLTDLHKFAWLNQIQAKIQPQDDAYFIAPSNNFVDPNGWYKESFEEIKLAHVLEQKRSGILVRKWYIYQLRGAKREIGNKKIQDYQE